MSERYNTKRLKREVVGRAFDLKANAAAEAAREEERKLREVIKKLRGGAVVVLCMHNSPWLQCRLCSKPRTK